MLTSDASHRAPYLAFLSSRLLLIAAAFFVLTRFPVHTIEPWQTQVFPDHLWIDGWVRWDSFWYEAIVDPAAHSLPQDHSSANFFPMYAWASWAVALPFRAVLDYQRAFFAGAWLLSHVAFLTALVGVYRVSSRLTTRDIASRAVWLMAWFPFSFFFSAVYSDALYLCLSVWAFWSAHTGRWTMAAVLAALATLTRITGFILIVALVVEYIRTMNNDLSADPSGERRRRSSTTSPIGLAGILCLVPVILATYFWSQYGDPLAFIHARQVGWQRATGSAALLGDLRYYTEGSLFSCGGVADCLRGWDLTRKLLGFWYLTLVAVGVSVTIGAWRWLGPGLVVWVVGSYAMALVNGLDGMGRFSAVLFPVFIALASLLRTRTAVATLCVTFLPFLLLFLGGFVRWRAVL